MCKSPSLPYHKADLSNTAVLVIGQRAELTGVHFLSTNAADCFLHFYDAAAAADVTVGTTAPKQVYLAPASDGTKHAGFDKALECGLLFSKGIVIAATDEYNVSNAPTAAVKVSLTYR